MKLLSALLAVALLTISLAPSAHAGCWKCGENGCCTEQAQGQYGRATCGAVQICLGTCGCINCNPQGNLCQGTAAPQCNNQFGACEEHQSLRDGSPALVPNGESIDLRWLVDPPVSNLDDSLVNSSGCAANA